MENVKEIIELFKENVRDYEVRVDLALGQMYEDRIPLSVADYNLYAELEDELYEYCKEHDLNIEDYDVEEIIIKEG